jgi:hypothetical protein
MNSLDIVVTEDEQFKKHYSDIMTKIKRKKLEEFEPTLNEIDKVYKIIIDYIKEKKRKIYGGYALNKLLIEKNKSYALYDELDTPDIDIYSPETVSDLVDLCDRLYKAGFKEVVGSEAQHKETYNIFVNYHGPYCDISYMPNNIYSKIRFIQLDGFYITHPWFMMIDYFRMFTDPIVSYWRLEKHFDRFLKLQKSYPLPLITKPLKLEPYKNKDISNAINILFDFVASKSSMILTGFYAYNYYLHASRYNIHNTNFEYIFMPYLEVYSSEYVKDGLEILEYIKTLPEKISSKLSHTENYPFSQFYGYNMVICYKDDDILIPILYVYSNNKRCLPYKEVEYIKFDNLSRKKPEIIKTKSLNIGCFDLNILHLLIILVKVRVDDDNDWNDTLYKLINGYVLFRNYYLEKKKLTIYDESIFQGFVVDCIGESISPDREIRLIMKARKKLGKPLKYRYQPENEKTPGKYIFLNSSGNPINKESNLKLIENNKNKKLEDEFEDEEKESVKTEILSDSEIESDTDNYKTNDAKKKLKNIKVKEAIYEDI